MDFRLPRLKLNTESSLPKSSYLSPITKRSLTSRTLERINFNKCGFSSPKCIRASHDMLMMPEKELVHKHNSNDSSKSILMGGRRIGEKLLLDSFPTKQNILK